MTCAKDQLRLSTVAGTAVDLSSGHGGDFLNLLNVTVDEYRARSGVPISPGDQAGGLPSDAQPGNSLAARGARGLVEHDASHGQTMHGS